LWPPRFDQREAQDVAIEVAAEKATIPIDRAVPAGLIVNELVRNSRKYAFGNGGGLIRVHFAISQISEPF
jgi:two-component sensor histidine kinase